MLRNLLSGMCLLTLSAAAEAAESSWGTPVAPAPKAAAPAAAPAAMLATAPTLKDVEALQKAVADAWEKTSLTERRALFVREKADLFGHYAARPDAKFKAGEKLVTYVEPVGYVWKANGETYDFGVSVDLVVKSPDGKILTGQDGFGKFTLNSAAKVQEFMLNLSLTLDGAPPGSYIVQYKLHDLYSDKTSTFELPFTVEQ